MLAPFPEGYVRAAWADEARWPRWERRPGEAVAGGEREAYYFYLPR